MLMEDILKGLAGVVAGGAIGAYLATSAIRWGRAEGASLGRSHCDACHRSLGWHETIPVISFICLRGRCATCRSSIGRFHLFGEAVGALLLGTILAFRPWPQAALEGVMALLLLWLALIDLKTFRLPNLLVVAVAVLGAVHAYLAGGLTLHVLVAISVGGMLGAMAYGLYRLKGRAAFGIGDIKLIMALSLWTGPDIVYVMMLGSLIGIVHLAAMRKRTEEPAKIPFGPALAVSAIGMAAFLPITGGIAYG